MSLTITTTWGRLDGKPTIASELAAKLQREPTLAELAAEMDRILAEAKAARRAKAARAAAVPVVFRVWPVKDGGDVIALFPTLPEGFGRVTSYQHIGQHGAADYGLVVWSTRPATPEEYAPLERELRSIGYFLTIRKRAGRVKA